MCTTYKLHWLLGALLLSQLASFHWTVILTHYDGLSNVNRPDSLDGMVISFRNLQI